VALTRTVTAQVQPLLDPDSPVGDPAHATCAMFYSITNCQQGLRGVSFGNVLIKQVVEDLGKEFPRVRTFATLSPIPGFRAWLEVRAASAPGSISPALAALVAKGDSFSAADIAAAPGTLQSEIIERCARYLISTDAGVGAQDPVARFHLANGARLERLNWMGDTSATGLRRSYGLTVNYEYRLAELERNHDAYANQHRVASSRAFQQLARPRRSQRRKRRHAGGSRQCRSELLEQRGAVTWVEPNVGHRRQRRRPDRHSPTRIADIARNDVPVQARHD